VIADILSTGNQASETLIMLAAGAGAPVTSGWMERMAGLLAEAGLGVMRLDFSYMTARESEGSRRPPPKAEKLIGEYEAAVAQVSGRLGAKQRLLIGGKSMGGRVASLAAQSLFDTKTIAGLVCLGYPFHPPDKPEQLRTAHLKALTCPTLFVQGERDPFGGRDDVDGYGLAPAIEVRWAVDGDHDFKARRGSGSTLAVNMQAAAAHIHTFADSLPHTR
jgi:uncharacterized protein